MDRFSRRTCGPMSRREKVRFALSRQHRRKSKPSQQWKKAVLAWAGWVCFGHGWLCWGQQWYSGSASDDRKRPHPGNGP